VRETNSRKPLSINDLAAKNSFHPYNLQLREFSGSFAKPISTLDHQRRIFYFLPQIFLP
jgi:hypothetical protein